jgi:Cft2 family RNA processing exonuclease
LLPTVPSDWYSEGKEIELHTFPTAYGTISIHVRSRIESRREIEMEYEFEAHEGWSRLKPFVVRFAPPGSEPKDVTFDAERRGTLRVEF